MADVTVHKFGGGILKTAQDYQRAATILNGFGPGNVVVVSAKFGVTDQLAGILANLSPNSGDVDAFSQKLLEDHLHALEDVSDSTIQKEASKRVLELVSRLNKVLFGAFLLQELTPRTVELVHSFGERLSAVILDAYLKDRGVRSKAWMSDDAGLIVEGRFSNGTVDLTQTAQNFQKTIRPDVQEGLVVLTGYFGKNADGHVLTLGRGGSDYSAGVVANALDAKKLLVWKDVEGFMSADPKTVPNARLIPSLTYKEAEELGFFGAKILHPKTMAPLQEKGIAVEIKSVFDPQKTGTVISGNGHQAKSVAKSVAVKKNACIVTLHGGSLLDVSSIAYPLFEELQKHDLPIDAISTSQSDLSLCLEEKYLHELQRALGHARIPVSDVAIEKDVSLLGLVGEGMRHTIGVSARLFSCLAQSKVNIRMISQGASEINITVAISKSDVDKALKSVHAEFIEGEASLA
ncbi:aspartate kinase [Candidatus Micrarchaeota archaeon]|nr:aspartate kinase [Candidatus Micrarchaeota archaeon]